MAVCDPLKEGSDCSPVVSLLGISGGREFGLLLQLDPEVAEAAAAVGQKGNPLTLFVPDDATVAALAPDAEVRI